MKREHEEKLHRVEEAIIAAHRGRKPPKLSGSFERRVMNDVRQIQRSVPRKAGNGNGFAQYGIVWKFAAATCAVAILSLGWFIRADTGTVQYEVAEYVTGNPSPLILAQAVSTIEPLEAQP
jgi:hypothetical protein